MSPNDCPHLENFKENDGLNTFRIIHAFFVVCSTDEARKTKVKSLFCYICKRIGPYLHSCLHCVYFACHKHIREHTKVQKHCFSLELNYGQVHCSLCNDYIYDREVEKAANENKLLGGKCRKRLFSWTSWQISEEERDMIRYSPKRICITPESTIGLRGLLNLGSTCFMNCIVQALMHTPLLRDYFLSERHKCKNVYEYCLVCELSRLFQEFYKGASVPLALHKLLYLTWTNADHLAGCQQHDAHEFLIATLDLLHTHCLQDIEEFPVDGIKKKTIIDQIFSGSLQSDVVCQNCSGVSTTIDPIWDFSLDLGPVSFGGKIPTTLVDCLERYTKAEHLGQEIICSNCESYQVSTKQLTIKTLPIVVSFHLKRFKHADAMRKISNIISFPEMLDMTPFMSRPKTVQITPIPPDNRYSLFAVINHLGDSMLGGHYTAYIRQQTDYWYKCDDHEITRASLQDVLDSEGYLLFYHKHILDYD